MKVAIAALLLASGVGVAMAQTNSSPGTSRAPGATEIPATGPATGTSPSAGQRASDNSGRSSYAGDKRTKSGGADDSDT